MVFEALHCTTALFGLLDRQLPVRAICGFSPLPSSWILMCVEKCEKRLLALSMTNSLCLMYNTVSCKFSHYFESNLFFRHLDFLICLCFQHIYSCFYLFGQAMLFKVALPLKPRLEGSYELPYESWLLFKH